MADPTAKEVLRLWRRYRNDVLGSDVRDRFENNAELAADFMAGRQKPKGWTDKKTEPYVVVNLIKDTARRSGSLAAGGVTRANIRATDPRNEDMLDAERMDHEAWQDMVKLSNRTIMRLEDAWVVGNSPMRHTVSVDAGALKRGFMARLDAEVWDPQQVYWDLLADDPFKPLGGSEWICADTLYQPDELVEAFGADSREIRRLGTVSGDGSAVESGDTITPLLKRLQEGTAPSNAGDSWQHEVDKRTEYVRVSEFQWKRYEPADVLGVKGVRFGRWWVAIIASDADDQSGKDAVVLDIRPLPYGMPTWTVICVEPPFGESVVSLLGDAQNAVNGLASAVLKIAFSAARNMNRLAVDVTHLPPDVLDMVRAGTMPDIWPFQFGDDSIQKVDDVIKPLVFGNYDVASVAGLIQMFGSELWDNVAGLHSIARGDVSGSSRLSSRSIGQLQQAVIISQELLRQVAAAQVTYDAEIGRALRRHHWSEPRTMRSPGGASYGVNQRLSVPVTPETVRMFVNDPKMGNAEGERGSVNGLRVVGVPDEDGMTDETPMMLSYDAYDEAQAMVDAGDASGMVFTKNDLAAADDIEYRMEIEADHVDRMQARLDTALQLEQMRPGLHSEKELWEAAHATDAGASYQEHLDQKFGETGAAELLAEDTLPEDRDAALQFLRMRKQQRAQQQVAPGGGVPAGVAA